MKGRLVSSGKEYQQRKRYQEKTKNFKLIEIPYIWFEIDPIINRLSNNISNDIEGGVMFANHPGNFQLCANKILWFGIPKELGYRSFELLENQSWNLAIEIPFSRIESYLIQTIDLKSRVAAIDAVSEAVLHSFPYSRNYFISIFTKTEVYRLFPFSKEEAIFLKEALTEITQMNPSFEVNVVRSILVIIQLSRLKD